MIGIYAIGLFVDVIVAIAVGRLVTAGSYGIAATFALLAIICTICKAAGLVAYLNKNR